MLKKKIGEFREAMDAYPEEVEKYRENLCQLLNRVECDPQPEDIAELKRLFNEFEVKHPKLTELFNQIMVMLSDIGI